MSSGYYKTDDLVKFGEVGEFAPELGEKFFSYYNKVMNEDGALTMREKALIALAVAHVKACPYCIDAYSTQCLETGCDPHQMQEAVHVGAVMEAGINLAHSLQMRNHLKKKGVV